MLLSPFTQRSALLCSPPQDLPFCAKEEWQFPGPLLVQRPSKSLPVPRRGSVGRGLPTHPGGDLHHPRRPTPPPATQQWRGGQRRRDLLRLLVLVSQLRKPFFHQPVLAQISHLHHLRRQHRSRLESVSSMNPAPSSVACNRASPIHKGLKDWGPYNPIQLGWEAKECRNIMEIQAFYGTDIATS